VSTCNDFFLIDEDFYFVREDWENGHFLLTNSDAIADANGWARNSGRFGED